MQREGEEEIDAMLRISRMPAAEIMQVGTWIAISTDQQQRERSARGLSAELCQQGN
jgi:hypothetical protein